MNSSLPHRDIVLLGAGHTHAHVLRMWRMSPSADTRLTCVTDFSLATYSGMLPGTLAGLYPAQRMQIDLVRFCAAAGVRLLRARVSGLDLARRQLLLEDRPPLPFDVLSIGIGSTPRVDGVSDDEGRLLRIKPMQTFLERLDERLSAWRARGARGPLRVAVVGAGAGGIEITFCLPAHVRAVCDGGDCALTLVDRNPELLRGAPAKTIRLVRAELSRRGVKLLLGQGVRSVRQGSLTLADGSVVETDLVLWATSAAAPALLSRLELPTDEEGFLLTRPTLQTVADAPVFAVGDAGTSQEYPHAKAGVYAVRQGPVLWNNLRAFLRGEPLTDYVPQKGFLSLLATGDRRAILSYKGLSLHAAWCWKLKDYIDGRFMDMYQDYSPPPPMPAAAVVAPAAMRCTGCGGKVGSSILHNVLRRLEIPPSEHVLLGLDRPDDAAIVQPPGGRPLVATVDFFASFLDDPYLVGRVSALNSLSDVFALGAQPLAAMAMATIPPGHARQQEQLLYELLAGALHELKLARATLIGGHTIEGLQTTIGFSLLADAGVNKPKLKGGLREGDRLVLTKPLGSGVLLAAHMQARCRAPWMDALLPVLLTSNQSAAALAHAFDIQGLTDVTGFGLAGHLLEMLRASELSAEISLDQLPLLPGVEELLAEGLQSTLADANRAAEAQIDAAHAVQSRARYAVLFDPQTSGGLLLGVPAQELNAVLARLADQPAWVIGEVTKAGLEGTRLRVS